MFKEVEVGAATVLVEPTKAFGLDDLGRTNASELLVVANVATSSTNDDKPEVDFIVIDVMYERMVYECPSALDVSAPPLSTRDTASFVKRA